MSVGRGHKSSDSLDPWPAISRSDATSASVTMASTDPAHADRQSSGLHIQIPHEPMSRRSPEPGQLLRKETKGPTRTPTIKRRLSLNPYHAPSIHTLSRAVNLAHFASLIVTSHIQLLGDGTADGRKAISLGPSINKYLHEQYQRMRDGEWLVSRENFQRFLEKVQGESCPKLTQERYRFKDFLDEWWGEFGLEAVKRIRASEKDLSRPISNYFISSSHNTYLEGHQWTGKCTAEAYRRVLRLGCRCVEIDVWDEDLWAKGSERPKDGSRKPHHSPKLSEHSLHTVALYAKGKVDQKIEHGRQILGLDAEKHQSSRHERKSSQLSVPPDMRCSTSRSEPAHNLAQTAADKSPSPPVGRVRDEPIVMHGYTWTRPCGFREVCRAINETAFETTDLPVIVSLEVHADAEQQEAMVRIMTEEWGEKLVDKPFESCPTGRMPALDELRNRILVKVKKTSPDGSVTKSTLAPENSLEDEQSGSEDDRVSLSKRIKIPKVPICETLSALAIYTHSEHFESFESAGAKIPSHIFSLSETKIKELYPLKKEEILAHNRRFLMRAYPRGLRTDSSNPNPACFWHKGVQMVAMNWQSFDEQMMLHHAMFEGENGWVLKPPSYRSDRNASMSQPSEIQDKLFTLVITVFSGQHIPLPKGMAHHRSRSFRPVVRCELILDKSEKRTGAENGLSQTTDPGKTDHPDFPSKGDRNTLQFKRVSNVVQELSFVKFKVEDGPTRLGFNPPDYTSWACYRLDRLEPGFRLIPLYNHDGKETKGLLLVRIQKYMGGY